MTTPTKRPGRPADSPGDPATSWVQMRVTRRRKAAWVRAAATGKLSQWVTEHLDRAAGEITPMPVAAISAIGLRLGAVDEDGCFVAASAN